MKPCSFEEFVDFIRTHQRIPQERTIVESTALEADLGVTGDDGIELLQAIQTRFLVSFIGSDGTIREAFGLAPDQYLFSGEGFNPFARQNIKSVSVGELYRATCNARETRHGA